MFILPSLPGTSPALMAVVISTVAMFAVATSFLVAAARLRRANNRKAAVWAQLESSLGAAIDDIASGATDAAALHARIRPSDRVILLDYLYKALASEASAARRELYRSLAQPYVGLLEERARTGDTWQRARALRTLAELAGPAAGHVVREALDDEAPHVATTAARVYAQLGLGPVDPLLDRIARYGNWDRRLLRSVLVSFGRDAEPSLLERLADEAAPAAVRAVCADALASLECQVAGELAAEVLWVERDVDLTAACLRLLRGPATPEQREIVRRLCRSEDDVIRGQAVACLARLAQGEASDLELVEAALEDGSPWVVRSAERGLSAGATGAADALRATRDDRGAPHGGRR